MIHEATRAPRRKFKTSPVRRFKARHRRDTLTSAGLCLSGSAQGPATHGVLCEACRETHRKSA